MKYNLGELMSYDKSKNVGSYIKNGKLGGFKITDNTILGQKKKLESLMDKIKPEFDMLKNKIDYVTEENKVYVLVGFSNPLSQNKMFNITQLIDENDFVWNFKSNDSIEELYATELEISLSI